ncbi:lipopolysaccharide biosynthesis protein [Mucilaginibacter myungsuensis]|uniref:Oligosaccharide flippase family protein n=1 Tax=Mucilaginibacter myungsuensis TaxID=649104 RepID=A0A929L1K2_9SPHI|nr:oligosaccharide flippase family protein [Mucilaginibacter myungsuensis]MBE9662415.1 oligosaccharide flippase family protein [Mucilaginibacter myungsuensis]MDN3599148.1 oligosaccharide flippase family protein [Mucilaginibacter myungsuensis]
MSLLNIAKGTVTKFFTSGQNRSVKLKSQIMYMFILKGLTMALSLVSVPLTLSYLDNTRYGIWVTISSFISWFAFLNIGLDSGLRNKFAECKLNKEDDDAQMYVSSTYAILSVIVLVLYLIFLLSFKFVPWDEVFNSGSQYHSELIWTVFWAFTFFSLNFIFRTVYTIYTADQKPSVDSVTNLASSILYLIFIFVLKYLNNPKLYLLAIAITLPSLLICLVINVWAFKGEYKRYRPRFKFVDVKRSRGLIGLGLRFFIIQIAGLIIFQTDNMVITHILGPAFVTPYYIVYRYFGVVSMLFTMLVNPFWSSFTEAWLKQDFNWISNAIKKLLYVFAGVVLLVIIMVTIGQDVIRLWIGRDIKAEFSLFLFMGLFTIISCWNNIFAMFLNGISKTKMQTITAVIAAIINIPLAIFLVKNMQLGIAGVILSSCASLSIFAIVSVFYTFYIIKKSKQSILTDEVKRSAV